MAIGEMTIEELIKGLVRACDLFDEIQRKKAVWEARQIIKEANQEDK